MRCRTDTVAAEMLGLIGRDREAPIDEDLLERGAGHRVDGRSQAHDPIVAQSPGRRIGGVPEPRAEKYAPRFPRRRSACSALEARSTTCGKAAAAPRLNPTNSTGGRG